MLSKKTLIIISSAILSALLVILAVFFIIRGVKKSEKIPSPISSEVSLSVSSLDSELISVDSESKPEEKALQITSPKSSSVYTTEDKITFTGTCDPKSPLTINGEKIECDSSGVFSVTEKLKEGKNTFKFSHKEKTTLYTVNYRYVILKSYNPSGKGTYSSGSTLSVTAVARKGSTVKATFNGSTVTLTEHNPQLENSQKSETFLTYLGSFKLPSNNKSSVSLGKIKFTATYNGKSESFSSGNITLKKPEIKVSYNPNAAPLGGKYLNVGTGKITEIVAYEAETFDAYSTNDMSRPTNNYLPKGTVDYSAQGYVYYEGATKKEYAVLRYGRQVYTKKKDNASGKNVAVVKEYSGTLPDHNEITISSFKNNGRHTVLTLDTLWKAPFYFDILPQKYTNPKTQDYRVSSVTSKYIDITLCYTTVLKGTLTVPKNNPIFSSAKIIKNKSDYTIRLYLKKQGGFYGWDANYNSKGQLVFEFLNPAYVETAKNIYGASLKGVKILIDVGHGGDDPGALGFDGKNHNEAIQNLVLANKIKTELQKIGATVYMTRTSNKTVSNDNKIKMLKELKPDFCIAVHHNSYYSSSADGFDAMYSHSFAKKAAELINMHTKNTGIYKSCTLDWHYYFMARSSYCPVVLTENGYISNSYDYQNIISSEKNTLKAQAIVKGIAEYFLYISPDKPYTSDNQSSYSSSSSEESSSLPQSSVPDSWGGSSSSPDISSSENESSSSSEESGSDISSNESSLPEGSNPEDDTSSENTPHQ